MKRELDVQQWGKDRGITICTEEGTPRRVKAQVKKLRSEYEEMLRDNTRDDLGDQYVVLSMIAGCYGTTADRCRHGMREITWDKITEERIEDKLRQLEWFCDQNEDNACRYHILQEVGLYVKELDKKAILEGWSLEECVEVAWNDIKDRKGCMVHDIFVKESNLALLETLGLTVQTDKDGQLFLKGDVCVGLFDSCVDVLHDLGYDAVSTPIEGGHEFVTVHSKEGR